MNPGEAVSPRPSRLGRYELITQIGQGGMAEVQLAIQRGPAGFEKLVVVKLVHENLAAQKGFVDMLLEEAKVAALVKHPNVVDIYDLGQAEGRYFIAMEYLEGEPLLAVLRAGREGKRLDPLSTGRLIADTAEGLDAAHELRTMAGEPIELVHHDVSLGNIVVLYNGQVKLVDFGVAKATQSAAREGGVMAKARVQGKFSYMAPEKLQGASGDRRSEIWSLGCVLWEALTLRRLFKGGNDNDTMRQVLETVIAAPASVNGDVPKDFDAIVMKALQRDPAKRYATAKEMAAELEEVLRQHKYGGKNDVIAKYMLATFGEHITARKKLLQEVSSKGRASADVLEAAFDDPLLATGTPIDFDKRRLSQEMAASTTPSAGNETTEVGAPPVVDDEPDGAPRAADLVEKWKALPQKQKLLLGGGVALALIVILVIAFSGGGGAGPSDNAGSATGSDQIAAVVPDAAVAPPPLAPDAAQPAAVPVDAAESIEPDANEEIAVEPGNGSGSGSSKKPPVRPPPDKPKQSAQELFNAGMKAYVKGDAQTAVSQYRKALQENARFATAWRALGFAHEKLGEWGQAKTAFQKYLALSPNASDAAQIKARIGNL